MRLKLILAAALIGAFVPLAASAADELELIQPGKLLIATEGTYPPFSMRAPDGTLDGLEIRVGKEIAKPPRPRIHAGHHQMGIAARRLRGRPVRLRQRRHGHH